MYFTEYTGDPVSTLTGDTLEDDVFIGIIRILLIWWLISAIMKFFNKSRQAPPPRSTDSVPGAGQDSQGIGFTGAIEDADFEEIQGS